MIRNVRFYQRNELALIRLETMEKRKRTYDKPITINCKKWADAQTKMRIFLIDLYFNRSYLKFTLFFSFFLLNNLNLRIGVNFKGEFF